MESLTVTPTRDPRAFRDEHGATLGAPNGWVLLPPGDAGLTRRVKAAGPSWTVVEKRGRKTFGRGILAPAEHIEAARSALETERADPAYARQLDAGRARRARTEAAYALDFAAEVRAFLSFSEAFSGLARQVADAVAAHATPVGSGTVARTKRIAIDERAEAAVIAWLRHQTTAYDDMSIARVKGLRREVRRELAARSRALLGRHRGAPHATTGCRLCEALAPAPARPPAPPPVPRAAGRRWTDE